jgi:hypothetical protein
MVIAGDLHEGDWRQYNTGLSFIGRWVALSGPVSLRRQAAACRSTPTSHVALKRKILMLDFDGVLHPSQGNAVPEFAFAPRLASALAAGPCMW